MNEMDPNDPQVSADLKKRNDEFRQRITATKQYRRKLVANWATNIDFRRGKPYSSQTDEDRVVVPLDWSLTKSKQAGLFSQVPQVHVNHAPQTVVQPWVYSFEQRLNDTSVVAGVESAMDECMADCINAAGIGVVMVSHEVMTEMKEVPAMDLSRMPPQLAQQILSTRMLPNGMPLPMEQLPQVIDHRYVVSRVSAADFLWPLNFVGSDFDTASWIGRTGRVPWAEAVHRFKLTEEDRSRVLGEERTPFDRLTQDIERDKTLADDTVEFDEIFFKDFGYDVGARSYSSIHHLVFVNGKEQPVIDEPWKGQELDQEKNLVMGAQRYPIRVLTLAYVSDETIPPSDTAMGRPQVNEINKSRTQMILQRQRSMPLRWFDVNRVDVAIQQSLMRGTWQNMIPVQGQGTNIIGEVARASYPQEDFSFDRIAKTDLNEVWQVGQWQDADTAKEAGIAQDDFTRRVGRERARVAKFFVSIMEVLGGLLCLYEPVETFGEGFDRVVSRALTYSILADSTVLVDTNQRLKKLIDFVNFGAKSGWVDIEPVMKEIATLSGLDPAAVIKPPQPKPPSEPNISLRLTGTEDMMNPLTLAFLMKTGQAPGPDLIEQAKQLIQAAVTPPPNAMPPPPQMMGPDGMPIPSGPTGPDGAPLPPGVTAVPPPMPTMPGMPNAAVMPPGPPPPGVGDAHPKWGLAPTIGKRAEVPGNQ